jgi:isopentenyl-diphosphate delta-isomerase type 1
MKDVQDEQFIVVNEKDEIVGYKTRYECHHNKSLIHRAINIALFNSKGQVVMQKRSMQKDLYPGYHSLSSTGHVSKGESYKDAALRELQEEMGVTNVTLKEVDTFLVPAPDEVEMIALFTGQYDGKYSYPSDEVESVHYFLPHELQKINLITPCSKKSLQILKLIV